MRSVDTFAYRPGVSRDGINRRVYRGSAVRYCCWNVEYAKKGAGKSAGGKVHAVETRYILDVEMQFLCAIACGNIWELFITRAERTGARIYLFVAIITDFWRRVIFQG